MNSPQQAFRYPDRRMFVTALASAAMARRVAAQGRRRIVLATAGQGGAFPAFGKAVAAMMTRHAHFDIELRETKGSNENADLIEAGEVPFACINMGPAFERWCRCTRHPSTPSRRDGAASRRCPTSTASALASGPPAAPAM
jgi:hypothetical protein